MIIVGSAAMAAPAMTTVQSTDCVPGEVVQGDRNRLSGRAEKTTVTPKRKSFQMLVNWKMPTTTKAGQTSGSMIWRKS